MRYFVCPVGSVHYSFLSGIASAGTMYPEQDVVRPARIRKTCTMYFKSRLPLQICKCLQIYFTTQFSKHAAITLPLPGNVHAYVIFNMVLIASRCVTTHKSRRLTCRIFCLPIMAEKCRKPRRKPKLKSPAGKAGLTISALQLLTRAIRSVNQGRYRIPVLLMMVGPTRFLDIAL